MRMQVHDPGALEELLQSSHGNAEPVSAFPGAVPVKRRGVPSAKPLAPRARARAATQREPGDARGRQERCAERTAVSRVAPAAPRPHTAPVRGRGAPVARIAAERSADPEGATALGHTHDLGLKRTFFWPTKVIAVDRVEPIGYRSTVGRDSDRVGFWEAGRSGPPGGYSRAPFPDGRKPRSANEVYGYTRRLTAGEQRERRKEERERARAHASAAMIADVFATDELPNPEPEPESEPEIPSAQKGAMIYVNTKHDGLQIHYSAHPAEPVHVQVAQFRPTKSQEQREQLGRLPKVIQEDVEDFEETDMSPARAGGVAPESAG